VRVAREKLPTIDERWGVLSYPLTVTEGDSTDIVSCELCRSRLGTHNRIVRKEKPRNRETKESFSGCRNFV
jgi:hypothetical protein